MPHFHPKTYMEKKRRDTTLCVRKVWLILLKSILLLTIKLSSTKPKTFEKDRKFCNKNWICFIINTVFDSVLTISHQKWFYSPLPPPAAPLSCLVVRTHCVWKFKRISPKNYMIYDEYRLLREAQTWVKF